MNQDIYHRIIEVESSIGLITVDRINTGVKYRVCVDGHEKHPKCSPEDAMRALATYISGLSYELDLCEN